MIGDDMGLGKTVQVATYLKGLFDAELVKKVLIVVPATMKSHWQGELEKWCYDCPNIIQFDDKKKSERYEYPDMPNFARDFDVRQIPKTELNRIAQESGE